MKFIKSRLFAFILGGVIFSSITAIALNITADQIEYDNNTTVKDKLDSLYTVQEETVNNLSQQLAACDQNQSDYKHIGSSYSGKNKTSSATAVNITRSVSEKGTYLVYIAMSNNDASFSSNGSRGTISGCSSKTDTAPSFTNMYNDPDVGGYANLAGQFAICQMNAAGTIKYTFNNTNDANIIMSVFKIK